jgi:hypothetical protein
LWCFDRHVLSAVTSSATAPVTAATLAITSAAVAITSAAVALALALALALSALALATAALALAAAVAISVAITSAAVAITSAAVAITSAALALALALSAFALAAATLALAAAALAFAAAALAALHRRGDNGGFGRRKRLHGLGARLDRRLLRGGGQRASLVRSSHSHIGLRTPGAEHRRRHARGCSDCRGGPRAGSEQRRQCLGAAATGP